MAWIPPLPWKWKTPRDYCELGQEEDIRTWIPAAILLGVVLVLLVIATVQGKI